MIQFEDKFLYLDNQKTGSTFISHLFKAMCNLEEYIYFQNQPAGMWYQKGIYTMMSIRHPIELYSSLYRYGLDGESDAYAFSKHKNGGVQHPAYDSFEAFCEWMLDPEGAARYLENRWEFKPVIAEVMGRFTWGFFQVALQWPAPTFNNLIQVLPNKFKTFEINPVEWLRNQTIPVDYWIRQESLKEDLYNFVFNVKPEWFNHERWEIQLQYGNWNSSSRGPETVELKSKEILKEMERKEYMLFELYGIYT